MEKYQSNRSGYRPYHNTCGMTKMPAAVVEQKCSSNPGHLPIAMAYVPYQENFSTAMELGCAFHAGTIFSQLWKPFCGKRGICR